jgi:two-component system cell cycle response regulator
MKDESFRALLIEADAREAEILSDLLREVGDCKLDVLAENNDAVDWLSRIDYHLVIMATGIEGSSELAEILERVKRARPTTAVLVLSAHASIEQAVVAMRMGADDYLTRPCDPALFKAAAKRALDRRAAYGQSTDAGGLHDLMVTCQLISASVDEAHVLGLISGYLARATGSDFSAVYRKGKDGPAKVETAEPREAGRKDQTLSEILEIALQAAAPFSGWESGESSIRISEKGQLTPALFVYRFEFAGGAEFFVCGLSPRVGSGMMELESRLRLLRAQIEVTARNIERYRGIERLAYVDDATGLYNTRYLNDLLVKEIERAQKNHKSFAVLFMDIDRFKHVNDSYGHLIGTKILHDMAAQLRKYVRTNDTVFRYGGDEFIAVLSPSDLKTAQSVAERIRAGVEKHVFVKKEGLNIKLTVSIGVALFPDHAASRRAIMEAADHAMYSAKKTSRNAVYVANLKAASA